MARSSSKPQFPTVTTAGGLLPADFLLTLKVGIERQSGSDIPGLQPSDYHLGGETFGEATNRAWNALQGRWEHFKAYLDEKDAADTTHGETWDRFLRPLFRELGYGQLERDLAVEIDADTYKITHHWREVAVHLLGAGVSIDKRTLGVEGAAKKSPHAMVQEFLNRSDKHLWAFVSNGLHLRILRDNVSLTRQAFVEFDLSAMFEGGEYGDFQLLWLLCHQSRVEGSPQETCWLERWAAEAKQRGVRMLDGLRDGVETAINALGQGFLQHRDNRALRERLSSGELSTQDYYREVLRIVYRLIFLFVAEDRNLLLLPDAPEDAKRRYRRHYATDRLRELSQRRRGSVHPDLWEQLKLIMRALGSPEGQPALALPALGSFLWDADRSTPDLANVTLSNTYLLDAIRALATVRAEKEKVRRVVDYRNLGAEELGSVYESLLELHPQINLDARTFALDSSAGNDRKTSGSYYTPDSLVQCLLDTALEPVIKDRLAEARKANHANGAEVKAAAQQQALLDLKVCDPAVGSGHFLIAAGHRIARHLARIRSGEEEPSPADYQDALRDVVGRCLYGVDLNPMAVELCKVSLWIEAMEPGKPLSFLDHHVRCGNSLLGTTPALIEKGIPDGAYKALTGDDKEACAFLKKRNKGEREGIGGLFVAEDTANLDALRSAAESVESIADDSITALQRKEKEYRKAESSYERLKQKQIADLWCAAFVWEKKVLEEDAEEKCTRATGITTRHLQKLAKDGTLSGHQLEQLRQIAGDYQFFHWHVEFPGVFSESTPRRHGFDCVLGNPPWDKVNLSEVEWFGSRAPAIADIGKSNDRKKAIAALERHDPRLWNAWAKATRISSVTSNFFRSSNAYPMSGVGDINTYAIFSEINIRLISQAGASGFIVPTGLATEKTTKQLFGYLVKSETLSSFLSFENEEFLFPGVHHSYKFALVTVSYVDERGRSDFTFFARSVQQASDPNCRFALSLEDFEALNPSTLNCPTFRSAQDAYIALKIYREHPVFDGGTMTWQPTLRRMIHMSDDAECLLSADDLESQCVLDGNAFRSKHDTYLPLIEAKMVHQFDHRFGTYEGQTEAQRNQGKLPELSTSQHQDPYCFGIPRYWIDELTVGGRLASLTKREWAIGWRDICRSTDQRTLISSLIPRCAVTGFHQIFCEHQPAQVFANLNGMLNSFVLDYVARQKVGGTHLTYSILQQLPIPQPDRMQPNGHSLRSILELVFTAWDLENFAQDCGYDGSPFRWDEERRFQLRSELDALFFHLFLPCDVAGNWKLARITAGAVRDETDEELASLKFHFPTPRDAVAYIMETFPVVKRKDIVRTEQKDDAGNITREGTYITKDRILEIYDQMLEAGRGGLEWQTTLDPPPASFRIAHLPRLPEMERKRYTEDRLVWTIVLRHFLRQAGDEATLPLLDEAIRRLLSPDTLLTPYELAIPDSDFETWKAGYQPVPASGLFPFLSSLEGDFFIVDRRTLKITIPDGSTMAEVPKDDWINYDVSLALSAIAVSEGVGALLREPESADAADAAFTRILQMAG